MPERMHPATMSTSYDVSDCVEAIEGRSSLSFASEKQQAMFELGVSMMIYKWDALTTAVANEWGGPESGEKRDWITSIVVDLFRSEKLVDVGLVEETLLYAMADEFETNVEDDSALPISAGIIEVYRQCAAESYGEIEGLYAEWQEKAAKAEQEKVAKVVVSAADSDSSEGEEGSGDGSDVEMGSGDDAQEQEGPVVDEDGFELVQSTRRRR